MRPAHGFAMQAIGFSGATATEAAGGSASPSRRRARPSSAWRRSATWNGRATRADRRRKLVRLTPRGIEALTLSATIFGDIRARWAGHLGADAGRDLEASLRTMAPGETFRLDVPGWFGAWPATVTGAEPDVH